MIKTLPRPSYKPKWWPTPSSCVLYLEGQQDAQSAKIRDLSGYGNHGTITGTTWVRLPSGLWVTNHDNVDDVISCGTMGGQINAPLTCLAWIKSNDYSRSYKEIFYKGNWIKYIKD
jgi:hypothetical protein